MLLISIMLVLFTGCSYDMSEAGNDSAQAAADLDQELGQIMSLYNQAAIYNGKTDAESVAKQAAIVAQFRAALKAWDEKYQSDLLGQFDSKASRLGSGESYPALTNLPINKDGAVYLSGGTGSTVGQLLDFISPMATAGRYFHGAILDLDKYDPTNLDGLCFETAVTKGAGYETPSNWMGKTNVAVFDPNVSINKSSLDAAQASLDYYCNPANTNMQYGFFKDYVNIFSAVSKEDNYYWYCTKVVWRVYQQLGINIDSNTTNIDWTTSGLYSLAKTYYQVRYLFNPSKAKKELNAYITRTKETIVLAEEIYFSPYLTKKYEAIRE